jgi:hypothetical protein
MLVGLRKGRFVVLLVLPSYVPGPESVPCRRTSPQFFSPRWNTPEYIKPSRAQNTASPRPSPVPGKARGRGYGATAKLVGKCACNRYCAGFACTFFVVATLAVPTGFGFQKVGSAFTQASRG